MSVDFSFIPSQESLSLSTSHKLLVPFRSLSSFSVIKAFLAFSTMKVHPSPKKRDLTASQNGVAFSTTAGNPIPKKLKRLPHVFARVLELPFNSDAEVFVQETKECFRFVANGGDITITDDFQAHVIEILPGVTKIAIRGAQSVDRASVEDLDIDMWRFRLPTTTFPKMTSARCIGGQLVVTVPKTLNFEDDDNYGKEEEEEECEEDTSKESLRGYFLLGEE